MNNITIFFYKDRPVQFDNINGQIMANATQMGKLYGVKPEDLFKTKSWKTYQDAIIEAKNIRIEHLRYAIQGGNNQGTWIHQELVIEFARRLNPTFSIWCNDRIAELIREGKTEISKPKSQVEALLATVQMLVDQEYKISAIEKRIDSIEAKQITSTVEYYTVAGYCSLLKVKVDTKTAAKYGREASGLCKQMGYTVGKITDSRYGSVNTYPSDILDEIVKKDKKI